MNGTEIRLGHRVANNYFAMRQQFVYKMIAEQLFGDVLEIGSSQREGVIMALPRVRSYTIISRERCHFDTSDFHHVEFHTMPYPPFRMIEGARFDCIVCFHALEKIKDDFLAMREIYRMLRPEGKLIVVASNKPMVVIRNPFHEREYTADELKNLISCSFGQVEVHGVSGDASVMLYHEYNRRHVESLLGFDFLLLHRWIPRWLLKIPYRFFDQMKRNRLLISNRKLVSSFTMQDYSLGEVMPESLELFFMAVKRDRK